MNTPHDADRWIAAAKELGAELPKDRAERLLAYLDAMLALNEHINLTAVRDRDAAAVLHVLDGLAFARTGLRPHHLLDLGSGNGFPGVAIAALHPETAVVLMDRTQKKVRAIGSCLVQSGFGEVETLTLDAAQAPTLQPDLRHAFDVVVARAVGRPEAVAPLAEPLCRPRGHFVMWLEVDAEVPTKIGRFRRDKVIDYQLPEPAARHRRLAVWLRT